MGSSKVEKEVVKEVEKDGSNPVRKTLAGRVIGYTGMDPPSAFSSLIEGDRAENSGDIDGSAVKDGDGEGDGDEDEISLSQADLEMIEYEKIKAMRRKRGTLKKNHKPSRDSV